MATATSLTVDAFEALPSDVLARHELVEGELVEVSSSTPENAIARGRLYLALGAWLQGKRLGAVLIELDVRTAPGTVRRPDIAVFSSDQIDRTESEHAPVQESPMIAIEVLSPSESVIDVNRKTLEYLASGSSEVWLVDPTNRLVQTHEAGESRTISRDGFLTSKLLPGFSVPVDSIFGWRAF